MIMAPVIAVALVAQRHIVKGMTLGARRALQSVRSCCSPLGVAA
jgi:hypothetical protein